MVLKYQPKGGGRTPALLRRFPVTTLLALQYLPLALIPAWLADNISANLISMLLAIALGSSLLVELFLQPLHADQSDFDAAVRTNTSRRLPMQARRLSLAAILVTLLAALTGLGSYGAGIGTLANSPIATLITPFRPWVIIAATLHVVSWKAGRSSRGNALKWIALLLGVELGYSATTAILAPLIMTASCVLFVCLLMGLVRLRWAMALVLAAMLAWPATAALRNAVRVQQGGAVYDSEYDSGDRLRLDLLMEPLQGLGTGVDVGQPGPVEILRYGLIPRAFDPNRPPITTGRQLNELVNGTTTSSNTFTVAGNIWLMNGSWGLGIYYASVALLISSSLARYRGPWSFAVVALAIQSLVWVGASYPESVIGFVQALVSLATARVLVDLDLDWTNKGRRPQHAPNHPTRHPIDPELYKGLLHG